MSRSSSTTFEIWPGAGRTPGAEVAEDAEGIEGTRSSAGTDPAGGAAETGAARSDLRRRGLPVALVWMGGGLVGVATFVLLEAVTPDVASPPSGSVSPVSPASPSPGYSPMYPSEDTSVTLSPADPQRLVIRAGDEEWVLVRRAARPLDAAELHQVAQRVPPESNATDQP